MEHDGNPFWTWKEHVGKKGKYPHYKGGYLLRLVFVLLTYLGPFAMFLVLLESPWQGGVHNGHCKVF
jgi:hypothetical protein